MSDPIPPAGLEITKTATRLQVQAQVRILVAAVAGAIAGRLMPGHGVIDDRVIDALTALVMFAGLSVSAYLRTQLVNSRWWHLALDPRVPDELVRPAQPKEERT